MMTLKDKLSRLTYRQACRLLGPRGKRLINEGGVIGIDMAEQVRLTPDVFHLNLIDARVQIQLMPDQPEKLRFECDQCRCLCRHIGAAVSLILEEKMSLGLAVPPPERRPVESLDEESLVQLAVQERMEKAKTEKMQVQSINNGRIYTDYVVFNRGSGKSYRVALRGQDRGESYCSCPDFRKNTLGTCKHIFHLLNKMKKKFGERALKKPFRPIEACVYLRYGKTLELRLQLPDTLNGSARSLLRPFLNGPIGDVPGFAKTLSKIVSGGQDITVYPDAEEYINGILYREKVKSRITEIRQNPASHPLRKTLLKEELLPYQLEGIAFAVGAGRSVIADDMGLGKTVQGIGTAELLWQWGNVSKVLLVCPATIKSQWKAEIKRFSNKTCRLVAGSAEERVQQYGSTDFFTICNYGQVMRDIKFIEAIKWDLIVLDEGQRIKNWDAKTSQTIKSLRSPYALVLTGTPLENRLDELHSVVEFIDARRLGPGFRFYNQHRVVDEKGKILGYKKLDKLRETLRPVLLRRTRKSVIRDLPARTTEIIRIAPTAEQADSHNGYKKNIATIINKKYLSEMDLLRLQKFLLLCRMTADSTFLVDKEPPGYSSKLEELESLLTRLTTEEDRKIVLFSEWTGMLNLIEKILVKNKWRYVRLDGSVPQKKRQALVHDFQKNKDCRLFITSNAGATGLNLQAADTVINVDLPWNPAVLEQRIARAHRMGQKRPVQVYLLVTEGTIEEGLLGTLSAKQDLFLAALDPGATKSVVDMASGIEALKGRLELLLGKKPDAPLDQSEQAEVENEAARLAQGQRLAEAGGHLLTSVFKFLGEMLPSGHQTEQSVQTEARVKEKLLGCAEKGEDGRLKMTFLLPDEDSLDSMARSLSRFVTT